MRFGMVTTFYPPYSYGGDATYVRSLARSLVELGHEVEVMASTDAYLLRSEDGGLVDWVDDNEVRVHRLRHRAGALAPLISHQTGNPALYARSLDAFFARSFDVLHFHNISLMGAPGVLARGKARARLLSLHDHWLICPTHVLWKNRQRACDRRTCLSCTVLSGLPPQLWRYTGLRERSLKKLGRLLAPSQFTASMHSSNGVSVPIAVLPLFSPYDGPIVTEPLVPNRLIYAGRLTALKGIQNLARTIATMPDVELLVIGDGELKAELQAAYGGLPNIRFLGKLAQTELFDHYANAAAVVVPSIVPETFGLTIVEAAACRTPAIVNKAAGGAPEIVATTGGGIIYQGEAELRAAVRAITQDSSLRDRLAAQARSGYEAHYTKSRHLDAYMTIVDELTRRPS